MHGGNPAIYLYQFAHLFMGKGQNGASGAFSDALFYVKLDILYVQGFFPSF